MERADDLRVKIVEGEELEEAKRLVADRYSNLAPRLDTEETRKILYAREYPNTFTLGAFNGDRLIGTTQLITGEESEDAGLPAVDAMCWVNNIGDWPHSRCEISETRIAEIGRFSLVRGLQPERKLKVTLSLFEAAAAKAREMDVEVLYAILPGYMVELVRKSGINTRRVEEATLRKTEEAEDLFKTFSTYWHESDPGLFEFTDYRNGGGK